MEHFVAFPYMQPRDQTLNYIHLTLLYKPFLVPTLFSMFVAVFLNLAHSLSSYCALPVMFLYLISRLFVNTTHDNCFVMCRNVWCIKMYWLVYFDHAIE